MRIQHNIMAMNAYRNYNTNTSALAKNLEKLSSGYKINRAGDDAAGLAISEKMRAQITGLNAAQKNVKDGISLVKTAEGAMQEVQDMLNRMEYLATQSANGTYDNEVDRANLQKEVTALKSEINRIADSANFNGIKLLDGSLSNGTSGVSNGAPLDMVAVNNSDSVSSASKDGQRPNAATGAEFVVTIGSGGTLAGLGSENLTGTALGSGTVSDLFDAFDEDGNQIDLTDASAIASGDTVTVTLVAKQQGALGQIAVGALTTALEGVTGVGTGKVAATDGTDIGSDTAGGTRAVYKVNFKDLSALQGGEKFTIGNKTFQFTMDATATAPAGVDKLIDISGLDLKNGTNNAYKELKEKILDAVEDAGVGLVGTGAGKFSLSSKNSGSNNPDDFTLTITSNDKGLAANAFKDPQHDQNSLAFDVDFKPAEVYANTGVGRHAQAVYDLGDIKVGDKITIGGKTIELIDKHDENAQKADAEVASGKLTLKEFKDKDMLNKALQSMGYKEGRVEVKGSKIFVQKSEADDTTAAAWSKGLGKVTLEKGSGTDGSAAGEDKGLTLQIGDTADSFNQLNVAIGDMHTKALGIDALNISNIEGAQGAIQTIKDAINNVSSVRGDLGAIQNRLEHTQNNLSVMAENIQDAESTIRDTDVAEEMMAYTKNNILIQSAQAMLAQANAVPQGVLQLLG
nr:flagellin [uncultured Oscillibacter sp.]